MKKIIFFLFKNIYLYTQSFGHAYCSFVNYPLKFLTGSQSVPKYQLVIRLYSPEVTNNIKFKTNTPSMKPKYSGTPGPRKARSFLRQYTLIGSRFIYLYVQLISILLYIYISQINYYLFINEQK